MKQSSKDSDQSKVEKETLAQVNQVVKNRFFNLNVTFNDYHAVLSKYQHAQYAVFTDIIENSMLDLIVVNEPTKNGGDDETPEIAAVYNNLNGEAFFIKARMLTDDRIGSPARTASFKAVLTNLDDEKFVVQGTDVGQSAFGSLQVPSCMIGVGRSNNFVETFTVSNYLKGTRSTREWSPIIPKSVLYVYTNMDKDPLNWQLSLLVNPTSKINLILIFDTLLLLIIGLIIIILYF